MGPTLAGFLTWIRNVMGIGTDVLPDNSPVIPVAYNVAVQITNLQLAALCLPSNDPTLPSIYTLAVYNLGGDNLVNYAPDVPDAPDVPGSNPPAPFFQNLRQQFHIGSFVAGVISGSSDVSTSQTILNPEVMKGLTFANLGQLKTPWGRTYLGFVQDLGPVWGLT